MSKGFPTGWQIKQLEDCMTAIIDYRGKSPRKTVAGVPLITAKIVKGGRIDEPEEFIAEEDFSEWMRRGLPKVGDVLMTTEAPLGEIAQLDNRRVALAQRLITLRGTPGLLDNTYLKFLMQSRFVQEQLRARSTGTTVLGIRQRELRKIQLVIPPIVEQRAIAHVLGTLDDKIELNHRMSDSLEAIAQAFFNSCFVASTQNGFPKGWREGLVGEEFELTMGQSPPGESYNESGEGIAFFQGRADFGFRYPYPRVFCTAPTRFATPGDSLVSVRAPVGTVNMAANTCCIGRGVAALRHKAASRSYTYYLMKSLKPQFDNFEAEGTVFGSISKVDFQKIVCVVPPADVIEAFERLASPIDSRIENNENESRTLAALRNALLPRLLSGQVRVNDSKMSTVGFDYA